MRGTSNVTASDPGEANVAPRIGLGVSLGEGPR